MRKILLSLLVYLVLVCSCTPKKTVTDPNHYDNFLTEGLLSAEKANLEKEIRFWQLRLRQDTSSYVNMLELATQYLHYFKLTGDINRMQQGDSLLQRSAEKLGHTDPEISYILSQQSIAAHRFREAERYANEAAKNKGDMYTVRLLQFDAAMELGKYHQAITYLETLKDKSAFDYLIRKAKWEDHKGNLPGAIRLMEQAVEKVKNKRNNLYGWSLSNLADMYGHAGRIKDSYNAYLQVLEKDPGNLYCLKGIAWIAFAHDGNTTEAKRILNYILRQAAMPDILLLLAEIADHEKNQVARNKLLHEFITVTQQPGYGSMYNKYLIQLYSEDVKNLPMAEALAKKELSARFTPETCDWLAWVYFQKGELGNALTLARNYVHNLTFEPEAVFHTAYIFAANGEEQEARKLLEECLESSFELGPLVTNQVREKLGSL